MTTTKSLPKIPSDDPPFAAEAQQMPLPSDLKVVFLGGLFLLASLAALYVAKAIILPVVLALVLKLLLEPALRLLDRIRIPRVIGALMAICFVFGIIVGAGAALSVPAATWAAKLPQGLPRLQEHLSLLAGPVEAVQTFLRQADHLMEGAPSAGGAVAVQGSGLAADLLAGTRDVADGLFTMILVLFFLLVSGDTFLRRLVEILPRFSDKRQAVDISQQVETDISAYLVTITIMNAAVGVATAAAMYFCGLGDPLLWGAVAFLLNFVPILGPLAGVAMFVLAGLLTFDSFLWALVPAGLYFLIHLVEGEALTPMLLARRFTLNPVLVILALVFWFWMWGVPGAILAVPMLAITKIVCDRIKPLMAFGHFLEG